MSGEEKYLLHLVKSAINDSEPENPKSKINWKKIYSMAYKHKIVPMVYYAISKLDSGHRPPSEVKSRFEREYKIALIIDIKRDFTVNQLMEEFTKRNIDYMLLKGMVIKRLYPISAIRSMTDVDILYRETGKNTVSECMTGQGYEMIHHSFKDDTYIKKEAAIKIELHRSLIEYHRDQQYKYLSGVWDRAVKNSNSYRMTDEDFYIYMIIHLAKHFFGSGAGIRQIADIWVFNKNHHDDVDRQYIANELERLGLHVFDNKIRELSEVWFNDAKSSEDIVLIAEYVISSGVFGTTDKLEENKLAEQKINKDSNELKIVNYIKNIFPAYKVMVGQYGEWLKRYPFLLPVAWIRINIERVVRRPENVKRRVRDISKVYGKSIDSRTKLFRIMGNNSK